MTKVDRRHGVAGRTQPPAAEPALPCKLLAVGLRLFVRLTPKSPADGLKGVSAGPDGPRLELRVRALPEDGAANAAAERLIARLLDVPRQAVRLAAGGASRYKTFDIAGDPAQLAARLHELIFKHR
jgi:uncharacterized protein YggU (UPF0235/DUF167 family)